MKSIIAWTVRNSPAMNVLVVAVMVVGWISFSSMRREVFPEFDLEMALVSVAYPGATPEEVEEGICQKVEEACRFLERHIEAVRKDLLQVVANAPRSRRKEKS